MTEEEVLQALEKMVGQEGQVSLTLKDGRTLEVTSPYPGEFHYFHHKPVSGSPFNYLASVARSEALFLLKDNYEGYFD